MRRRKAHRKRRERRQHFGDLVQMDGSFHAWFEERGPRGCLMNMVDDATATTCCRLGEQETIWAAGGVLRCWIGKYGVPQRRTDGSAMIGWCSTGGIFCNSSRRINVMGRHKPRRWCVSGRMARWRYATAVDEW